MSFFKLSQRIENVIFIWLRANFLPKHDRKKRVKSPLNRHLSLSKYCMPVGRRVVFSLGCWDSVYRFVSYLDADLLARCRMRTLRLVCLLVVIKFKWIVCKSLCFHDNFFSWCSGTRRRKILTWETDTDSCSRKGIALGVGVLEFLV